MKAAVVEQPGKLAVREVPDPQPDPYQALVRIEACAICNGTDRKVLEGRFPGISPEDYPAVLGHESIGTVVRVGEKCTKYKAGDRVLRPRIQYGAGGLKVFWGGFAQYGLATDAEAFAQDNPGQNHSDWAAPSQQVVPTDIDTAPAAMLITLKETADWLRKFDVPQGGSVLIFGTGPVGLAFCQLSKLMGAGFAAVVGRREEALKQAHAFGADAVINSQTQNVGEEARRITGGRGFDRAVDAIGLTSLIDLAPAVLAPGGRFGLYGVEDAEAGKASSKLSVPAGGEWSLWQMYPAEHLAHEQILDWVRKGHLRPSDYVTHCMPLEDIKEGFDLIRRREALKVVIEI